MDQDSLRQMQKIISEESNKLAALKKNPHSVDYLALQRNKHISTPDSDTSSDIEDDFFHHVGRKQSTTMAAEIRPRLTKYYNSLVKPDMQRVSLIKDTP